MLKTENYNLNKPEGTDPLRLADFNQNSDIIDGALKNLSAERVITGSYTGDGADERIIDLPFTPKVVLLFVRYGINSVSDRMYFLTGELCFYVSGSYVGTLSSPDCTIVGNGLQVGGVITNSEDKLNRYIAFR